MNEVIVVVVVVVVGWFEDRPNRTLKEKLVKDKLSCLVIAEDNAGGQRRPSVLGFSSKS